MRLRVLVSWHARTSYTLRPCLSDIMIQAQSFVSEFQGQQNMGAGLQGPMMNPGTSRETCCAPPCAEIDTVLLFFEQKWPPCRARGRDPKT